VLSDKYIDALLEAQEELAKLDERRTALVRLVENLKFLAQDEGHDELTPAPGYEPEGLTAEIRKILELTTVPLTAVQIRDSLISRGFRYSSTKNLLIGVHTVLGRISEELETSRREGKPTYIAKRPSGDPHESRSYSEERARAAHAAHIAQIQRVREKLEKIRDKNK